MPKDASENPNAPAAHDDADARSVLHWDDAHIEAEAELLPKDLREPYRRVKLLCREEFGGDLDRITAAFAKAGAPRHRTTWSRVFQRQRLTHSASGQELPAPLVAWKSLREEFHAFLEGTRVELQRGRVPFVETAIWELISSFVDQRMRPEWVNKFGVLRGPTGLQKSASFRELAARNPNIKHVECAENASLHQLITLLALRYGVSHHRSHDEKRYQIYHAVGRGKCIIVDNTQDLLARADLEERRRALKFFRWLQDERGCTVIWSITPADEDAIFGRDTDFMEQFEGRAGGRESFLRLPNQNPKKDLVLIATALGLKHAERHADDLQQLGTLRGRIRPYFEILQSARFAAEADRRPFTYDYIEEVLSEREANLPEDARGRK